MIDFIGLLVINSAFIWGIHCAFSDGFFLAGPRKVIEKTIGTTASKPLFGCPACMSSLWGITGHLVVIGIAWTIIPYVICLCGINYLINEYLYPTEK